MNLNKFYLTDEESYIILDYRAEKKKVTKEKKNALRKYFFNKWALYDLRQTMIRETVKTVYLVVVIEGFLKLRGM